jgi:hypothetical protein
MKKTMGMFLAICIFTCFGGFLMSEELLELEIVKEPTFKEVGGFWFVYMDVTCPRNKMGEMTEANMKELEKQGIKSDWTFMIFGNWPDTEEGILKWERGLVVPQNTKCSPPLKIKKIEKFKALTYTITGKFTIKDISKGNQLMDAYIKEKGYKHIWPIYEIFKAKPRQFHFWYLVEE